MYLKFNKDVTWNGKTYLKDGVYYVTNAQRHIDSGDAEKVEDYDKYHDENLKGKVIDAKKADQS